MFIWIFVHLNKSSFNFIRLIFRSSQASRSRRFCGSWLQSVSRLSALVALMAALLAAIIHPMRLKARSQLFLPTFFGQDWFRRHFAISPFWEKKSFRHSEIDCDQKKWVLYSTTLCGEKKAFFCEASKKNAEVSFFSRTLTFFVRKRVQELLEELSLKIALK